MMQHRLVVDPSVVTRDVDECKNDINYSLFHQMARITRERGALRHDDRLDCLSMLVAYWVEQMDADAERLESQRKEEALEEELRKFIEHAGGQVTMPGNWVNW